jgi:DNA-binding protein
MRYESNKKLTEDELEEIVTRATGQEITHFIEQYCTTNVVTEKYSIYFKEIAVGAIEIEIVDRETRNRNIVTVELYNSLLLKNIVLSLILDLEQRAKEAT